MKFGVITFPGSNCDEDILRYLAECEVRTMKHWYQDLDLDSYDGIVLPGGFSYGDHLRAGAIAARCSLMEEIRRFAKKGKWVLGICNGFQILTEAQLLPGALTLNQGGHFLCSSVRVIAQDTQSPWIPQGIVGKSFCFPIAHAEGRFRADEQTLKKLKNEGKVAWVYEENLNGSDHSIAGICVGKVLGMMPHPERSPDGKTWFKAWLGEGASV